jgi:hypothetical protein
MTYLSDKEDAYLASRSPECDRLLGDGDDNAPIIDISRSERAVINDGDQSIKRIECFDRQLDALDD